MVAKVSQYPWHMKVVKENGMIIIDSFDGSSSYLDMFTTNENTQNNMPPDENKIIENCTKATNATKSFKKQLASEEVIYECEEKGAEES